MWVPWMKQNLIAVGFINCHWSWGNGVADKISQYQQKWGLYHTHLICIQSLLLKYVYFFIRSKKIFLKKKVLGFWYSTIATLSHTIWWYRFKKVGFREKSSFTLFKFCQYFWGGKIFSCLHLRFFPELNWQVI